VIYQLMFGYMLGIEENEFDFDQAGFPFHGSRPYINLSMFLHLMGSGKAIAKQAESTNALMVEILLSCDLDQYRPAKPPQQFRIFTLIRHTPRVLWRLRTLFKWLLKPLRRERFQATYTETLAEFETWVSQPIDYSQSLGEAVRDWNVHVGLTSMMSTGPALIYFIYMGTERIKRLIDTKSPEQVALADAICRGYPDDQVVQMGMKMFDLSTLLPATEFADLDVLLRKIDNRELPESFTTTWDAFIEQFGSRGPLEMELANPGYGEDPLLALHQIAMIANSSGSFDPHDMQRKLVAERESAYEKLLTMLPRRKRKRLSHAYENILRYSGSRELIKHHMMQVNERIRKRLLRSADDFIASGRLDSREQIFDLTMADIDRGTTDPDFDLRAMAEVQGAPYRKLKSQVRHFPMAIDSRGRILRPERKNEDGALVGTGVSPGVVRGPVKVLNDPFEKEVLAGDVLVAVTTDPGWTPLFINAAAVLLEIGGELQHGALVAREYGKPCVAGISDVTTLLSDGQMVEVDGNTGTVRVIDTADVQLTS
ncbi:MAG: PEP-utilizing enzyme, partial [Gammaproteobacteria bacterium]|nr:PEP-utilizing enzyme [Gammaproteobacteria bacterium]